MKYDVIVVGAGIAGLTTAAFLSKEKKKVLLIEKEDYVGGLVNSFNRDGFLYDGGARGVVDSGVVKPMLKALGIDIEFMKSKVSIGIENEIVKVETKDSLENYQDMLKRIYPENVEDISRIIIEIKKVMDYMSVLYGIENPLFKDLKNDKEFLFKTLLPWVFRYLSKVRKINKLQAPIDEYLLKMTSSQSLIDIISQHFFQKTPASFALSYFSLYLDYEYPIKGMKDFPEKIKDYIIKNHGEIALSTKIRRIEPIEKLIYDEQGNSYSYDKLVWAADIKTLYDIVDLSKISNKKILNGIEQRQESLKQVKGSDSTFTLYLALDIPSEYFGNICTEHFFYTPSKKGQSEVFSKLQAVKESLDKVKVFEWLEELLEFTTYEISIPALRNKELSPQNKTGLIISILMDYDLVKKIKSIDIYEEFKEFCEVKMIKVLNDSIFDGISDKIIHRFSSSPLSIERISGNLEGAITGFSFTNEEVLAINKTSKITKSCLTKIPDILQAGQWTYIPSGVPISILTGKIAADKALKNIRRKDKKNE
jgi:phytoene dehydrogenase-like protein